MHPPARRPPYATLRSEPSWHPRSWCVCADCARTSSYRSSIRDPVRAGHDVQRPPLDLVEDPGDVLADHSEDDELDTPDDPHENDDRRPARNGEAADQPPDRCADTEDDRGERYDEPDIQTEAQRAVGEPDDRVGRKSHHPYPAVLAATRGSRGRRIRHARLGEADPAEHATQVAIRFPHRSNGGQSLAIDQSEVAGTAGNVDVGQSTEKPVEPACSPVLEDRLAHSLRHHAVDDLVALLPASYELRDHFGRVLEIAVHRDDGVAAGEVEPRRERDLMAEAARQSDDLEPRVRRCGARPPARTFRRRFRRRRG